MLNSRIKKAGTPLHEAKKAMIFLHGRGGSAEDILSLAENLDVEDFALLAPQAKGNTWYPNSFMASRAQNEPYLTDALELLKELVVDVIAQGINTDHLYFVGFSQGACLMLEFAAKDATKYGGLIAFTGGLIGDELDPGNYTGDFEGTPVLIGTSNPDPHVPLERVKATEQQLLAMNAKVKLMVFNNMGHTINQEEINAANELLEGAEF
jgi:phospholipase/carboxylesterase